MSMSVKAMGKVAVQQDQVGLVAENMNHIATVLEESYGVKAIPMIDPANDECQLVLKPKGEPIGMSYYYDVLDMLEIDAEKEAAHLEEFLATYATKRPKG